MPSCFVAGCPVKSKKQPQIVTLFNFPKTADLIREGLLCCGVPEVDIAERTAQVFDDRNGNRFRICSNHFSSDLFMCTSKQAARGKVGKLVDGAIPNVKLAQPGAYAPTQIPVAEVLEELPTVIEMEVDIQPVVWFNVQHNSAPMTVKFDIAKETLWKPLFPKTAQPTRSAAWQEVTGKLTADPPKQQVSYLPTNRSMVEELEKRVERTLKNKLMEWRSKHPTRWNRQCISIFRKILPKLEFSIGSNASVEETEFTHLKKDYEVTGFPLRLPYTSIQSIIEAVQNTEVHATEIPNTEFAVAAYIYPYPNNILSVWVYLASLVRSN